MLYGVLLLALLAAMAITLRLRLARRPDPLCLTNRAGGAPWFGGIINQRGVHHNGVTYVCFQGGGRKDYSHPYVMSYSHADAVVRGPVRVGDDPLAESGDTHGNPGMLVDDLGYIHVIYGGHGVDGGAMRHAISHNPEDISAWDHLDNIRSDATYPTLIKLDNGTIVYFYRAGSHRHNWVCVVSTDHGRTFSEEEALMIAGAQRDDGAYYERTYCDSWFGVMAKGKGNTLHYLTRYHACGDDRSSQYHIARRVDLYYMRMDEDGVWRNIQGDTLELPVGLAQAQAKCRIYESNPKLGAQQIDTVNIESFTADPEDNPYILFSSNEQTASSTQAKTRLAIGNLAVSGFTFKDAPAPGVLFRESDGRLEIINGSRYVSIDNGDSWSLPQALHPRHGLSMCAPLFNAHPNARVIATEPQPYPDYRRIEIYLWGDNGFITP